MSHSVDGRHCVVIFNRLHGDDIIRLRAQVHERWEHTARLWFYSQQGSKNVSGVKDHWFADVFVVCLYV